jgi:hypothetical protein
MLIMVDLITANFVIIYRATHKAISSTYESTIVATIETHFSAYNAPSSHPSSTTIISITTQPSSQRIHATLSQPSIQPSGTKAILSTNKSKWPSSP